MLIPTGVFDIQYIAPAPEPIDPLSLPPWLRVGAWARERSSGLVFRICAISAQEDTGVPGCRVLFHGDPEHHTMVLLLADVLRDCEPAAEPVDKRPTAWTRLLKGIDEKE